MNPNQLTCDPSRIERFLRQQLSDQEQSAFEFHLDDCTDCQTALEITAASDHFVSDMRASLLDASMESSLIDSAGFEASFEEAAQTAAHEDASFQTNSILDWLAPTDDDRMLGRLGPYEIIGVVGSGGMGVVLKAFDAPLNRYVAIKVLSPHLASSGSARKRFSREAQAAAAVVHENVIEIHSVAEANGLPYLVMPYVRGPSLQKRLDDDGPFAVVEILRIGRQAAAGLSAAHAQGLVHRDVKPANVMLADGVERAKLTDFGLARAADDASLTQTGIIAGTPQYMSPEQARGEAVETRSDLFSLGSVLYALCTGRAPFRAETTFGVLRRITDETPRPIREINPDIPDWLCGIVERLMSKEPAERYRSASEVASLLESCLAHVQHPTSVPLPPELARRPDSRRWFLSPLVGVISVFAFALVVLGVGWQATQPYEIDGQWQGEGWGAVTLTETGRGKYQGTYTDTFGEQPGAIALKWSRLENQYKGTWREGKDRFGKISLRKYHDELRGAWTANKRSKINGGNPELSDLTWRRPPQPTQPPRPPQPATPKTREDYRSVLLNELADAAMAMLRGEESRQLQVLRSTLSEEMLNEIEKIQSYDDVDVLKIRHLLASKRKAVVISQMLDATDKKPLAVAVSMQCRNDRDWRISSIDTTEDIETRRIEFVREFPDAVSLIPPNEPLPTPSHDHKIMFRIELKERANSIAWSFDGELIAVGKADGVVVLLNRRGDAVRTLDLLTDEERNSLESAWNKSAAIQSMAVARNSRHIALGGAMGMVKVFDLETCQPLFALDGVNRDEGDQPLHPFLRLPVAHGTVSSIAFSQNRKYIATCGSPIDYKQNGMRRLGAGPDSGILKIWDAKTGSLLQDVKAHFNAYVSDVAFSLDNKYLAAVGSWRSNSGAGQGVKVFRAATGDLLYVHKVDNLSMPLSAEFSNDSRHLYLGFARFNKDRQKAGGTILSLGAATGVQEFSLQTKIAIRPIRISQMGRSVIAMSDENVISLWNATTGELQTVVRPVPGFTGDKWQSFSNSPAANRIAILGLDSDRKQFVEVRQLDNFDR